MKTNASTKPLQLARSYMEIFYSGTDLLRLMELMNEDCHFKGPLFEFYSVKAYVDSLLADPPLDMHYKELTAYENENSACLIYQFSKPGIEAVMCQRFTVVNAKISDILLIFDTGNFSTR